ncbi:MAG: o-succinylbenzoate synthase [Prevotella sp.]|nr:o-succinylbenzoate synthase [Prevotella sp.]
MSLRVNMSERVLHFKQPAGTSRGVYTERRIWLVTMTDGERVGVGECAPLPQLSCDDIPNYAEVLRRFCDQVEQTGEIDTDSMRDYPSMLFGLETALLDVRCKKEDGRDMLFDTPFSRGEEGIPINGLVWMGTYEEMRQRIEQKLEQGFHCVKLKIGAIDFEAELELLKKIRERFGPRNVELRVDANGAFPYEEALYKLELLSQYALHSIEQPIKAGQWSYMAELCRESPLRIALDEELIGVNDPDQKRQMLNIIRPAYIILKPSLHGGMTGVREWVEMASDMGIGSWITSALESNIGLNAIAQLASDIYGPAIRMPQGLGTGQLFTDNIPMPLEIRGDRLWVTTE